MLGEREVGGNAAPGGGLGDAGQELLLAGALEAGRQLCRAQSPAAVPGDRKSYQLGSCSDGGSDMGVLGAAGGGRVT